MKKYRLYCEYCAYNRISDGTDIADLIPYKRSPIQTALPKLDPKGKLITKKFINLPKQFKCPQCGKLITPKKMAEPQEKKKYEQDFPDGSQGGDAGPQI